MATFHFKEPSKAEINIEISFGIQITQVRGLNPPNPKEIFTRDWAEENGVDTYIPATRKVKSSEVTIEFYAEDGATTAVSKYDAFCHYLLTVENPLQYRDTVQYMKANLIYTGNNSSWYQLFESTPKKLVAQVTLLNPTGAVDSVDVTPPVITMEGISPVNVDFEGTYVDAGATASDDVDGNITANIVTTGTVDTGTPGTYTIHYNVADAAGNNATEVTRTVVVAADPLPVVITEVVSDITSAGATFGITISSQGASSVTERGWQMDTNATDVLSETPEFSQEPSLVFGLSCTRPYPSMGLSPDTLYYYVAYATNTQGTTFGEVLSFTTEAA